MIGKFVVKLMTRFALKRNDALRVSEAYDASKRIGLIYTFENNKQEGQVRDLMKKFVKDGKSVEALTFLPKVLKMEDYDRPSFTESDFSSKGKWKNDEVKDFRSIPFDFLICADKEINKYIRNILASSKAKCRVGPHLEDSEAYFELMINHGEGPYTEFLKEVYHYITQMKNG